MSQETSDAYGWRAWRKQVLFWTAAITGLGIVWGSLSAAWAMFELPAPVVLNARYERDMRTMNDNLKLTASSVNILTGLVSRWQRSSTASELREVERQIVLNQGKPDVLKVLYSQRDMISTQRDEDDATLRRIVIPGGGG